MTFFYGVCEQNQCVSRCLAEVKYRKQRNSARQRGKRKWGVRELLGSGVLMLCAAVRCCALLCAAVRCCALLCAENDGHRDSPSLNQNSFAVVWLSFL
jgi:hypothetical protein